MQFYKNRNQKTKNNNICYLMTSVGRDLGWFSRVLKLKVSHKSAIKASARAAASSVSHRETVASEFTYMSSQALCPGCLLTWDISFLPHGRPHNDTCKGQLPLRVERERQRHRERSNFCSLIFKSYISSLLLCSQQIQLTFKGRLVHKAMEFRRWDHLDSF